MRLVLNGLCIFAIICTVSGIRNNTLCPQVKVKNARVRYMHRSRFVKFTCIIGYVLAGEKINTCVNGNWDSPLPKCVRPTCNKVKAPPNIMIIPSHANGVLNFFCVPGYVLKGPRAVYCDGRRWDSNLPTCVLTGQQPPLSCDFESSTICGWTSDLNHDFDWRRLNFNTPSGSIGTGPSYDHTKGPRGDGYYMYIESSSRHVNDTARLISPVYEKTQNNTCFEFYYHMFGATIGELRVYLKKASDDWTLNGTVPFFSKQGNQGDQWYRSFTSLGIIAEEFQIVIEGIRGNGYVSDIAIDDVNLLLNCNPNNDVSSTTDLPDTEQPYVIESCENRCSNNSLESTVSTHLITCDCDDACSDRGKCCPDYIDFCLGSSLSTNNEEFTTQVTEELSTSPPIEEFNTTSKLSNMIPTFKDVSVSKSTTNIVNYKNNQTRPNVVSKIPKIIILTPPQTTTPFIRRKFVPTLSTSTTSTKQHSIVTEPRIIYIKYHKPKEDVDDVEIMPVYTESEILLTSPVPDKDISSYEDKNYSEEIENEINKNFFKEGKNEKIVVENKETSSNFLVIIIACITIVALIGIVSIIVTVKYQLLNCSKIKRRNYNNGDSQSDVRFLTGDEVLDFSLPTDYSTL